MDIARFLLRVDGSVNGKWLSEVDAGVNDYAHERFHDGVLPRRRLHSEKAARNALGARLRFLRESLHISHFQMLDLLREGGWDLDPATLTRIEQGTRTLTDIELQAFLRALGGKWADLDE